MTSPTYREIVRDLERRGYERARVAGSHATYRRDGSVVTVCIAHLGDRPQRRVYRQMCDKLGFSPGRRGGPCPGLGRKGRA